MASAASLYGGTGRPGPDILYAPLAAAPQFVNAGIWRAAPILVSGASSYRSGEYVYQDFLYDDHGAVAPVMDPTDVRTQNATSRAPPAPTPIRPIRTTRRTPRTSSNCA